MTPTGWWIVGLYVTVGAVVLVVGELPRFRNREAQRLARSLGMSLDGELDTLVRRRIAARRRGAVVGALLGVAATVALLASETTPPAGSLAPLILAGGVFGGLAVGAGVVAGFHSIRITDDRPRVARAEAVTLNDYVAWIERWGARIPVALAIVFLAFSAVLATLDVTAFSRSPLLLLGGLVTLAAIAALAFFEVGSRQLIRKGQPSASPAELAWDDALRSLTIRDMVGAPLILGVYGTVLVITDLSTALAAANSGEWVRIATLISVNVLFNAVAYIAVLALLFAVASKPQRHFLRRLWPELANEVRS